MEEVVMDVDQEHMAVALQVVAKLLWVLVYVVCSQVYNA